MYFPLLSGDLRTFICRKVVSQNLVIQRVCFTIHVYFSLLTSLPPVYFCASLPQLKYLKVGQPVTSWAEQTPDWVVQSTAVKATWGMQRTKHQSRHYSSKLKDYLFLSFKRRQEYHNCLWGKAEIRASIWALLIKTKRLLIVIF